MLYIDVVYFFILLVDLDYILFLFFSTGTTLPMPNIPPLPLSLGTTLPAPAPLPTLPSGISIPPLNPPMTFPIGGATAASTLDHTTISQSSHGITNDTAAAASS